MDQSLIEASLEALDEMVMDVLAAKPGKFDFQEFDSEIMGIVFSVTAEEPAPQNIYDRLDLSCDCLKLASELLRSHGHFGFAALLNTMVEKNEIALELNPFLPISEPAPT
jgi:hypothetical protein